MRRKVAWLLLPAMLVLSACSGEATGVEGTSAQVESVAEVEPNKAEEMAEEKESSETVGSDANKSESQASEDKKRVLRVTVKSYDTQDGQKITDVFTDITEQTFDGEGNMVLEEIYGGKEGDRLKKRTTYTYDENGNVLHSEEYLDDALGMRTRIWEYEYDEKNQKIKAVHIATKEGQKDTIYLYSYDEVGKLAEQKRLQEDEIHEIIKYIYDEAGNILCESSNIPTKGDTWEDITYQYVYDDAGNMLTKAKTGVDVIWPYLWSYEYDEQGNCIKEACLWAENDPDWIDSREYDAEGRLLKSVTAYGDGTGVVEEYQYEMVEE